MTILELALKLQKDTLHVSREEHAQNMTEVQAYQDKLTKDSKSKIDQLYLKIHSGPWFNVASTFIYVFARKWFNDMVNPTIEDEDDDLRTRFQ